jgi:hypothetical protein
MTENPATAMATSRGELVDRAVGPRLLEQLPTLALVGLVPGRAVGRDDLMADHLFAVAAGLDSMVIGETQIHAQVREALRTAEAGLFNSCARPADSFPRAMSFSRCWSVRFKS